MARPPTPPLTKYGICCHTSLFWLTTDPAGDDEDDAEQEKARRANLTPAELATGDVDGSSQWSC